MSYRVAVETGPRITRLAWSGPERSGIQTASIRAGVQPGIHRPPAGAVYQADGEWLTVGRVSDPEPLSVAQHSYSGGNRVMVRYALEHLGIPRERVEALGITVDAAAFYEASQAATIDTYREAVCRPVRGVFEAEPTPVIPKERVFCYPTPSIALVDRRITESGEAVALEAEWVAIVEVGVMTTRMVVVRLVGDEVVPEQSVDIGLGLAFAAKRLKDALESAADGALALPMHEAFDVLWGEKTPVLACHAGGPVDWTTPRGQALDALGETLVDRIPEGVNPLFVGEGAGLLGEQLVARCHGATAPAAPAFATVRGVVKHLLMAER